MSFPFPASRPRRIAFFLTAHGFGHGVRAAALAHALPADIAVDFHTALPEGFFREELVRPFRVLPCELDCGCVQKDSASVDVPATLERYAGLESRREAMLAPLAERLRDEGVDLVIGDIPPLAFPLARRAGIPSVALCNFSWVDIYAPYVERHPRYAYLLEAMRRDYAQASAHWRLSPFFGEKLAEPADELGMVCRLGRPRREELAREYGLDPARNWCLVYLGNYGLDGVAWSRLEDFDDWQFLGLYDLGGPANYRRLEKTPALSYADLTASSDLVLGKLGYGLVSECLAHAVPVLFPGRTDFAEFEMLRDTVTGHGLGLEISLEDLKAMRLRPYFEKAVGLRPARKELKGVETFLRRLGLPDPVPTAPKNEWKAP